MVESILWGFMRLFKVISYDVVHEERDGGLRCLSKCMYLTKTNLRGKQSGMWDCQMRTTCVWLGGVTLILEDIRVV